jgi:hypothetical protein
MRLFFNLSAGLLLWALTTPARAQSVPTLARTLVGTAGTVDGFSALTFGEVGDLGFDHAGRLYVLDTGARHVAVIDTTGALLDVVGRPGQGPGEFGLPSEMHVYPDGGLAVVDFGRGLVILDSLGTEVGALRLTDAGYNQARAVTAAGEIVSWDTVEGTLLAGGSGPRQVIRGPPDQPGAWRVVHQAPIPNLRGPDGRVGGSVWSGGLPGLVEFVPEFHVAVMPDGGLMIADTTTYRILRLAPDGSPVGEITRDQAPRPVTERMRDEARIAVLEALDTENPRAAMSLDDGRTVPAQGYARQIQRQRAEVMRFGEEAPVIRGIAADAAGRLWVLRETENGESRVLDLFDAEGRFLGTPTDAPGRLPDAFGPRGLTAWLEFDDFGVARIRIERWELRS